MGICYSIIEPCVCVCVCVCVHVHVCVFIYTYVYVYMQVHKIYFQVTFNKVELLS